MYIDPSAGSLAFQLVAAAVLSVTVTVGRVREAAKTFLKSLLPRRGKSADRH
jgi:hypothetical protein